MKLGWHTSGNRKESFDLVNQQSFTKAAPTSGYKRFQQFKPQSTCEVEDPTGQKSRTCILTEKSAAEQEALHQQGEKHANPIKRLRRQQKKSDLVPISELERPETAKQSQYHENNLSAVRSQDKRNVPLASEQPLEKRIKSLSSISTGSISERTIHILVKVVQSLKQGTLQNLLPHLQYSKNGQFDALRYALMMVKHKNYY